MSNNESPKETVTVEKERTPRDRSPNYPSLKFSRALDGAKKIWEQEKRHPVNVDVASKHLGYKKANGVTLPMVGAMKKYGLLVSAGKENVRVSDDAHTMFLYPDGEPEALAIKRRLAMKPALFVEVLTKFPDGLPSDANLRARLQTDEWGFTNEKAADNFIAALREAVEIANENVVADGANDVDNGGETATEPPMPQSTTNQIVPKTAPIPSSQIATSPTTPILGEEEHLRARLADNRMVRVLFRGEPPTQDEIEQLIGLLKLSKDQYPKKGEKTGQGGSP